MDRGMQIVSEQVEAEVPVILASKMTLEEKSQSIRLTKIECYDFSPLCVASIIAFYMVHVRPCSRPTDPYWSGIRLVLGRYFF